MFEFYKQFVKKQPFLIAAENCYRASRFTLVEWLAILAILYAIFRLLEKALFAIM
jgi:hypothetical protein